MHAKFLRYLIHLFLSFGMSMSAFAFPKTEEAICYKSMQNFMVENFGKDYAQDENLVEFSVPETSLSMITDKTPTTNPPRYLLESRGEARCLVLSAPAANEIKFSKTKNNGLPREIKTITGGQSKFDFEVIYKLNKKNTGYQASSCRKIFRDKSKSPSLFPCRDAAKFLQ